MAITGFRVSTSCCSHGAGRRCDTQCSWNPTILTDGYRMEGPGEITEVLRRLKDGDGNAFNRLLSLVYDELRFLAAHHMRGERRDHTLAPTALVHEVYLKLLGGTDVDWENRSHFFGIAARAMRQILIDHARIAGAGKRGADWTRRDLEELPAPGILPVDLIALDEALSRLAEVQPRKAQVVELRYFAGLSSEETARVLDVTKRTVERDWRYSLGWLFRKMRGADDAQGGGSA